MDIKNVLTNEELESKFLNLCESNRKVKIMAKGLSFSGKAIIDNWFAATRPKLLDLLEIQENEDYPLVYHSKQLQIK